ncbi:MAG: SdrD B-like domain-containing protein, partial [Burkholderiaceae bacterium]
WANNSIVSTRVSNIATAAVRVVPDPTFDCSDIIGKVFDDKNANGYQDQGEPGIANVRLATARGLLVTTDAEGRFHVACADIPQADHGSNFVMKLDERTLPSGYRLTTENPRDVRVTRGKMAKLNFGATVHRVVRLELTSAAFIANSIELQPQWATQLQALPNQLKSRPSVLRISYAVGKTEDTFARKRLDAVAEKFRTLWQQFEKKEEKRHPLVIETELEGAQ